MSETGDVLMLASDADETSLWLLVGIPLLVVALAQSGAIGVAWVSGNRVRATDRKRFLTTERRNAYSEHLASLENLRDAAGTVLMGAFVAGDLDSSGRGALMEARHECESKTQTALLLGSDRYVQLSEEARRAVAAIEVEIIKIDGLARGIDAAVEEILPSPEVVTELMMSAGVDEIHALREVARMEIQG